MRGAEPAAGFTLIETLVALIIFVAGYLLIYQSVSLGWHGAQAAAKEIVAVRLAQARLAAAGVDTKLVEGSQSGETADGYSWTVDVRHYREPHVDNAKARIPAYWVSVEIHWREGVLRGTQSLQLTTLKFAGRS